MYFSENYFRMKPLKSFLPLAGWLLRFATAIIVYSRFWNTFQKFNLENIHFYISAILILGTFTLLIGGFTKRNTTTVLSGVAIFGVSVALIFLNGFTTGKLFENFVPAALGFYFVARGNA